MKRVPAEEKVEHIRPNSCVCLPSSGIFFLPTGHTEELEMCKVLKNSAPTTNFRDVLYNFPGECRRNSLSKKKVLIKLR